jgi:uncharacterized protein YabE (DUF348 family)
MRSLTQKYPFRRQVISLLSFLLVFFFGAILTSSVQAATTQPKPVVSAGEHLVTIHDNGKDKGILTKASTLREAFKASGIRIDPNDLVEPSLDEELVATNYEVNIYRARPITIVDGSVRTKVMSAYQTPQQITEHAGIILHDEDITDTNATSDIVSEGTGIQMTIKRATPVNFVLYGKKIQAYTQEKTVGDMLKKKDVTLGKDDTLSVALNTPITAGMTIELWRNGKQTVTEDQDIAFETEKVQDADHEVGYKEVKTPGENGKKSVTYEIEMKNGVEVGRKEIQSVVTKEAKKQVEVVGTKVNLPPGSHEDWMAAAGISSSDFGYVNYIIMRESSWNPASASADGRYYGLGQTNLKAISSACPSWQTDPVCQLGFFSGYAVSRYKSWQGAYEFKKANGWW